MSTAAAVEDIRARLQQAFAPSHLEVIDEGALHIGHAAEGTGHFRVRMACAAFVGKTRVEQHRLVYDALAELMGHGIHALALETRVPNAV